MKKIVTVLLLICILSFPLAGCGNKETENGETEIASVNIGESENKTPPILGIEIEHGETVSFVALSKSGTYSWSYQNKGKTENIVADGIFCLELKDLATVNYKDTDGKAELKFTGSVKKYTVYRAKVSEIENDKLKILDEKYKSTDVGTVLTFPNDADYYYTVSVEYAQGSIDYGFMLKK